MTTNAPQQSPVPTSMTSAGFASRPVSGAAAQTPNALTPTPSMLRVSKTRGAQSAARRTARAAAKCSAANATKTANAAHNGAALPGVSRAATAIRTTLAAITQNTEKTTHSAAAVAHL